MSSLKLYKASAGSGKTFALTREYLRLILRQKDAYRHILAVTFTNKAAGEMKERILSRLYRISVSDPLQPHDDRAVLAEQTGIPEKDLIRRSGELLGAILNDYSAFSVGTIDKFFQSVIRAFTREIGIQPSYNLELDTRRIIDLGVDRLFMQIGEDPGLERWLTDFALERLEEARSWNFRQEIQQLGMELFRESFQAMFTDEDMKLLNREKLDRLSSELDEMERSAGDRIRSLGKEALQIIRENGLQPEDFKSAGHSPAMAFRQAAEHGEVNFTEGRLKAMEQPEKWLKKEDFVRWESLTVDLLIPLLGKIYDHQVRLNTAGEVRRKFHTLGILTDLHEGIRSYLKENNLFLIADAGRFLKGILGESQVPFVFERTGNRYSHIMLDEFQDTSVFQYENFRPLLEESLAHGNESLVVGDVKQSIYRWRNSDWMILARGLEQDMAHQRIESHTLLRNYRSREEIIRFNNTVFQLAPKLLADQIGTGKDFEKASREEVSRAVDTFLRAYSDVVQQLPDNKPKTGGHVRVHMLGDADEPFADRVLGQLPQWIDEILEAGISHGEIAILVRTGKEGVRVARRLLEHAREKGEPGAYRLVSSDSLLISSNEAVKLVIAALRYLAFPGDGINNAQLKYRAAKAGLAGRGDPDRLFLSDVPPEIYLPEAFTGQTEALKQKPLFELVEELIGIFAAGGQAGDAPYLQALQDLVMELQQRDAPGIPAFLDYWQQFGSGKGIRISENSDAIRIMTVHRAKGLEFRAVVIPFCDWEVTTDPRKDNVLWCDAGSAGIESVPLLPVRYSSRLKHTVFAPDYFDERMKGYLDSLNLLYVAFTRAEDVLLMALPQREKNELKSVGDLLPAILAESPTAEPCLQALDNYVQDGILRVGDMPEPHERKPVPESWMFNSYDVVPGGKLPGVRLRGEYRLAGEEGIPREGRNFGNVMHLAFSGINTRDDVNSVLEGLQVKGILPAAERPGLEKTIRELLDRQPAASWFEEAEGRKVIRERSILGGDGEVYRPDRVLIDGLQATVIDFKFGRAERPGYHEQVRAYMRLLKDMGYEPVKGFLWYAMLDKTEQITP